jgi:hypothetical protein
MQAFSREKDVDGDAFMLSKRKSGKEWRENAEAEPTVKTKVAVDEAEKATLKNWWNSKRRRIPIDDDVSRTCLEVMLMFETTGDEPVSMQLCSEKHCADVRDSTPRSSSRATRTRLVCTSVRSQN